MPALSGEPSSSRVCILLVCAVHVVLPRLTAAPSTPAGGAAGNALAVRLCSGCALAQREGDGALDMRGQCDSVVGARWQ